MPPSPISTGAATATLTPSALPSPRLAPPIDNYASSIASGPRGSISQTDLHSDLRELRAKAKRWARWSRDPAPEELELQHRDGWEGPIASAAETAVDVNPQDVVERGMYIQY